MVSCTLLVAASLGCGHAVPLRSLHGDLQPLRSHEHEQPFDLLSRRKTMYDPGQRALPLVLPTLSGDLDVSELLGSPVLFNAYAPGWGFSNSLWADTSSIDAFIARDPSNAHFVFLSYSNTDAVVALEKTFHTRVQSSKGQSDLLSRLHFVNATVEELGVQESTFWLSDLLEQYPTYLDVAETQADNGLVQIQMLNSQYDWLGWSFTPSGVFGNESMPLHNFGNGCSGSCPSDLSGHIALIDAGSCDYYTKVKAAATCNASGVAVISSNATLYTMNCATDAECNDLSFGLPAFMIQQEEGAQLQSSLASGKTPSLSFKMSAMPGTDFGIDSGGRLRQTWGGSGLGNAKDTTYGNPGDMSCKLYPSLEFVAWAAQWMDFQQGIDAKVSTPAHVVPVFAAADLRPAAGNCYGSSAWGCGPAAVVDVPSATSTGLLGRPYTQLELEFSLGCGDGSRDIDCPKWDHVITMLACCSDAVSEDLSCDASHGFELGRWITTFGRGVGHWVTDVSSFLPLLSGGSSGARACNLTVFSVPWAGNNGNIPWTGTLNLRFGEPPQPPESTAVMVLRPWANVSTSAGNGVYQYFDWIAFNQSYETNFHPFEFDPPASFSRAEMTVVVSGHGSDNHGCGEFCTTTHHFTLNGHANVKDLDNPDNANLGCADSVTLGTTPNEYGTWLYGRDGWCDGREVVPWVVDVTSQLKAENNVLDYRGFFNGTIPEPSSLEQGAPVMMLRVYVTFFQASQAVPIVV